jgi:hypothetical protein
MTVKVPEETFKNVQGKKKLHDCIKRGLNYTVVNMRLTIVWEFFKMKTKKTYLINPNDKYLIYKGGMEGGKGRGGEVVERE